MSSRVASRKRSLWRTSSSSFATRRIRGAEAQCLNELVDDANMAEHMGPLLQSAHILEHGSTLFALHPRAVEWARFFGGSSSIRYSSMQVGRAHCG
jgi:hypothetical protein